MIGFFTNHGIDLKTQDHSRKLKEVLPHSKSEYTSLRILA